MNEQTSLHEDISFLRKMAESGRRGQILGGVFLAGAGMVFGVASFISWAGRTGILPVQGWDELYLWLGAGALFIAYWLFMFFRFRVGTKGVVSASNAMFGAIWSACAGGVMVSFCTTLMVAGRLSAPVTVNAYIPVIFAFYGTAWFACAFTAKRTWMYAAGLGSYAFALVIAALTADALQSLAMGVGLILLIAVPGFKLMSDEARS
jgi:hypothetical protein